MPVAGLYDTAEAITACTRTDDPCGRETFVSVGASRFGGLATTTLDLCRIGGA